MDLAFLLRAERMLGRSHAAPGIDHAVLVATLAAHQAASATATAAARIPCIRGWNRPSDALVELLAGGPEWRAARQMLRGRFNRGIAAAAGNCS